MIMEIVIAQKKALINSLILSMAVTITFLSMQLLLEIFYDLNFGMDSIFIYPWFMVVMIAGSIQRYYQAKNRKLKLIMGGKSLIVLMFIIPIWGIGSIVAFLWLFDLPLILAYMGGYATSLVFIGTKLEYSLVKIIELQHMST